MVFAGHVVGNGQRKPIPGKVAAIEHWEKPKTVSELRAYLGFCNYYSGYIKMYAEYAAPMTTMLKGNREETKKGSKKALVWTEESDRAFEGMKQALLSAVGLHLVDPDRGFVLRTDASDYAVGAVLEQVLDDGRHVPVAFWSRVLAEGQRRTWTPREKEAYAIVMALTVTEATHKSTLNLLARKLRPKMALEDTLWIYYGESRTARVADLRNIIPRHIQRAIGPFTVYAVPHPITAPCTHCNPRCALPCAGALQQPLPTPTYRGGIFLGTIPGDPHPYLLPAADRHHAIPLHLVEHLAVRRSPFQKRPPHTPSDGRPPDEPTHATPGPKRAIALLTLKAAATILRDLEGENHLMVEGLTEHVLIAAMYATASASRLWEDRPSPPLAQAAQDAPDAGPTAEEIHQILNMREPRRPTLRSAPSSSSAGTQWMPPRPPRRSTSSSTGTPGGRWNGTTTARSDGQRHTPPTTKSRPHHAEETACDSPHASPTPQRQPGKRCTTPSTGRRGRQKAPSPRNAPQRGHATPPATRPTCAATGQAPGTGSSPGPRTRPTPCRSPRKCLDL